MKFMKWLLRLLILSPILYWILKILDGSLGADPAKELNHKTGFMALVFLLINLWIGCLLWLYSKRSWKMPAWLRLANQQRRFLGITNFIYLCFHLFLYLVMEGFEKKAYLQIFEKTYLIFGILAYVGMLVLAFTSNDFSLKKLGGKKWKRLHRLVYVIFALVLVHTFNIEKADLVLYAQMTFPMQLALLTRLLFVLFSPKKLHP